MDSFDELMEVENEVEEFEGSKDYSTAIGAGALMVAGAIAYEGVKHGVKYAKIGVGKFRNMIAKKRGKKDETAEDSTEAEVSEEK